MQSLHFLTIIQKRFLRPRIGTHFLVSVLVPKRVGHTQSSLFLSTSNCNWQKVLWFHPWRNDDSVTSLNHNLLTNKLTPCRITSSPFPPNNWIQARHDIWREMTMSSYILAVNSMWVCIEVLCLTFQDQNFSNIPSTIHLKLQRKFALDSSKWH